MIELILFFCEYPIIAIVIAGIICMIAKPTWERTRREW